MSLFPPAVKTACDYNSGLLILSYTGLHQAMLPEHFQNYKLYEFIIKSML